MAKNDKYCPECNELIPQTDDAVCPSCGHVMKKGPQPDNQHTHQSDVPLEDFTFLWAVFGFLLPILGLLAYFLFRDTRPISADRAKQGAIIGLIILIPAFIFFIVVGIVAF